MTDEKFEEFLQREAKAYNTPPGEVPREEMWQVIAAARAAQRGHGASTVTPLPPRRPRLRVYAPIIGMAATLLLGVGIGRFVMQTPGTAQISAVTPEQRTPATPAPAIGDQTAGNRGTVGANVAPDDATPAGAGDAPTPARQLPVRRALATNRMVAAASAGNAEAEQADGAAMDVVSREHLGRAEALISVVAATPRDATMDSLTARWAREMLSGTRLLLDSPAGDDPVRRRLLEDLETLLVQLVQRSGGPVDERDLIDRTLERTQLLTRLRTGAAGI